MAPTWLPVKPTWAIVAALPELAEYENDPPTPGTLLDAEVAAPLLLPPAAEASATPPTATLGLVFWVMTIALETEVSGPFGLTLV